LGSPRPLGKREELGYYLRNPLLEGRLPPLQDSLGETGQKPQPIREDTGRVHSTYGKKELTSASARLKIFEKFFDVELADHLVTIDTAPAPSLGLRFIPDTTVTFGHQWSLKAYNLLLLGFLHSIPPYGC
jgi:hypothetical protein